MWVETHRCCVDGCPNLAAYEALHYDFDLEEGAVVLEPDEACPYLCVEHAVENERAARGERGVGVVEYPYTNHGRRRGLTIYRQPAAHFADDAR